MRIRIVALHWFLGLSVALALWLPALAYAGLGLHAIIPLPSVRGAFGHLAVDAGDRRLYACVAGDNRLLVIDLSTATVINRLSGLDRPQGVVYLPTGARVAVSNAGSGELDFYHANDLAPAGAVSFGDSAGDLVHAAAGEPVYLGYGNGDAGGIAVVSTDGIPLNQFPLASRPAGFVVDRLQRRLYVNLPARHAVAVVDLADGRRVASWTLGSNRGRNSAMALDAARARLFIATDGPDRILVLDAATGRVLQSLDAPGDVGALDFDPASRELYAAGAAGRLVVYTDDSAGLLKKTDELPTGRGANRALLDVAHARYYLAVPAHGRQPAEIRVYNVDAADAGGAR